VIVDIGRIASIEKIAVYGVLTPRSNNIQLCRPVASHWQTLSHNVVERVSKIEGKRECIYKS
jgi:hypothetical protein